MSKILTTVTSTGTRKDFYTAIKEKFIALGLEYNADASSDYKVVFNFGNFVLAFVDQQVESINSYAYNLQYGTNADTLTTIAGLTYCGTAISSTEQGTRTLSGFYAFDGTNLFFNGANYTSTSSNATYAFIQINKPDKTSETVYANALTSDSFTVLRSNATNATKFSTELGKIRTDINNAVLLHPMFRDANNNFLGVANNMTISNVGTLNTKYVINGSEYLSVLNGSNNSILIPFPEIIN